MRKKQNKFWIKVIIIELIAVGLLAIWFTYSLERKLSPEIVIREINTCRAKGMFAYEYRRRWDKEVVKVVCSTELK